MKILYATTTRLDEHAAAAHHVRSFCGALVRRGHHVELLRHRGKLPALSNSADAHVHHTVPWPAFRGGWRIFAHLFGYRLGRLARAQDFDLVFVRLHPWEAVYRPIGVGGALWFTEMNGQEPLQWPIMRACAHRFDHMFTDSKTTIDLAAQTWDIPSSRFSLLPMPAIDARLIQDDEELRIDLSRRYFGDTVNQVVVHTSSFRSHHDFDTIIEAVRRLNDEVGILFLGEGARLHEIREKAQRAQVPACFAGSLPLPEMMQLVRSADVAVNALHEWSQKVGNVRAFKLYEYMAAGVPTVETVDPKLDIPAWASQYLELVHYEDADALFQTIARVLSDQGTYRRKAAAGRDWVNENQTWDQVVDRVIQRAEMRTVDE